MMTKVKFIKEPGYIMDLFYLFAVHFNGQHYKSVLLYHAEEEINDQIKRMAEEYGPFPEELLPFFALRNDKVTFMTRYYFSPYCKHFTSDYDLDFLQKKLSDYDQVIDNLLQFYFSEASQEELAECKTSIKAVNKLIKESALSADLKNALYAFFIDPVPVMQKLSYELMTKGFQLSQQYDKEYKKIAELQNNFDFARINTFYKDYTNSGPNPDQYPELYVTFTLNHIDHISWHHDDEMMVALLGTAYENVIQYLMDKRSNLKLKEFGAVISEQSRQEIFEYLLRNREATIKEIEKEFGFTAANTYYHVAMMVKTGALKTRNQGRTLFYSLNGAFFEELCQWFGRYIDR